MSGHNGESTNYVPHAIVLLGLTALMYLFAFILVDHNLDVPGRVDTVHAAKGE